MSVKEIFEALDKQLTEKLSVKIGRSMSLSELYASSYDNEQGYHFGGVFDDLRYVGVFCFYACGEIDGEDAGVAASIESDEWSPENVAAIRKMFDDKYEADKLRNGVQELIVRGGLHHADD